MTLKHPVDSSQATRPRLRRCVALSSLLVISALSLALSQRGWAEVSCEIPDQTATEGDTFVASSEAEAELVQREYKLGQTGFKAGRYQEALSHFLRVYRVAAHPNLVYNIAVSFEKLKEYQSAISFYRCYLKLHPKSEIRAKVTFSIDTLTLLDAQERKRAEAGQVAPQPEPTRVWAWSGVALGGSALIGGAILGGYALSLDDDLGGFSDGDSAVAFRDLESRRDSSALTADVLMISGALLTSVSLYFALREAPRPSEEVSVSSSDSPLSGLKFNVGLNALTLSGAF